MSTTPRRTTSSWSSSVIGTSVSGPRRWWGPARAHNCGVVAGTNTDRLTMLHERTALADVVITTARVPGLPAPRLIPASVVERMKPGSVIVDLAADMGGNCELTQTGGTVVHHDVTIHGPVRLASTIPVHATQMYSKNITAFLLHLTKDGAIQFDSSDEITTATCVTREGAIVHAVTKSRIEGVATAVAG